MTAPLPKRSWIAIVLAGIVAAIALGLFYPRAVAPVRQSNDITVVKGREDTAPAPVAPAHPPALELPKEMLLSLKLPPAARLREPLSDRATGSIVCGTVSADGGAAPYQRFFFNRAGRTGAVDDGTELFKRFADKICQQR